MARAFNLSQHSRASSAQLFNSFYEGCAFKWRRCSAPRRHSISRTKLVPLRTFCSSNCAAVSQNDQVIDMRRYNEAFSKRMALAGLKPHHRIALGVSGGPDSMALCVLAANWKKCAAGRGKEESSGYGYIEGLLGIIVDHGLRAESSDEANLVSRRVAEMGIRCEIALCEWRDGKPKKGHLQEAARDMRYQKFQEVCVKNGINALLVAHHADDQAELFIIRLSRNSGVLGLAGMAFTSQIFSSSVPQFGDSHLSSDILLVRPLLDFSKNDMYKICKGGGRQWVEDPTNQSQLYARNRIRKSLGNSSGEFDYELQAVIRACQDTRIFVDRICRDLLQKAVTIAPDGYAVIDSATLNPAEVVDICLSKFLAHVLQFVSQRHKPIRGSVAKLLLNYIRTIPCKTSLTAAGCYLSPAPGSKGTKILVCISVNHPLPSKLESDESPTGNLKQCGTNEIAKIIADGRAYADHFIHDDADVFFLKTPSDCILHEAYRQRIVSEDTYNNVLLLQKDELERFRYKTEAPSDVDMKQAVGFESAFSGEHLHPGKVYYFMKRILVKYEWSSKITNGSLHTEENHSKAELGSKIEHRKCQSCVVGHDMAVYLRHMLDTDWLYLAKLSNSSNDKGLQSQEVSSSQEATKSSETMRKRSDYIRLSAHRSLLRLKKIPVAARRPLPVLVDSEGTLLAIPSIGFNHCPHLSAHAEFKPRVPLGGGHSSFI